MSSYTSSLLVIAAGGVIMYSPPGGASTRLSRQRHPFPSINYVPQALVRRGQLKI